MPPTEHILVPFSPFGKGIDHESPRTFIPQGFVAHAKDVLFNRGIVSLRNGYQTRRASDDGLEGDGFPLGGGTPRPVIALPRIWDNTGAEVEICMDSKRVYSYAYATGALTSAFVVTSPADIDCFEGSVVGNISWTTAWDGDNEEPVIVFTDGIAFDTDEHTVYKWNGVDQHSDAVADTARDAARIVLTQLTGFQYAKQIAWYADHFMIGDYYAGSKRYRNRVAWGDSLELGLATAFATGEGAEYVLGDAKGYMQRFIRIGAHLVVYFSESIVVCDPVPTDDIFAFDVRVQGIGLIAPNAVVDLGGTHVFIGQDNIYAWEGGLAPVPIGDNIRDYFFDNVNANALDRIVTQHLPTRTLIVFYYPKGDSTYATAFIAYNYREQHWTYGEKALLVTSAGWGSQAIMIYCDTATWKDIQCDDAAVTSLRCSELNTLEGLGIPTLGTSGGYVLEDRMMCTLDGTTAISGRFDTDAKPMGRPYGAWGRVSEVHVESKGDAFELFYTLETDLENPTWISMGSVGGNVKFKTDRILCNVVAQFMAFRFDLTGATLRTEVRVMSIRARPTTPINLGQIA